MRKFIGLFVALVLCTAAFAQKEKLELNLTKGETYPQKSVVNASIVQTIQGMPQTIEMTCTGLTHFKVLEVKDSNYKMEVQYKKLIMKLQTMNGTMEFNSESKDENDIFSRLMASLVDQAFYIQMNKQGKVSEVTGIDPIFSNMFAKYPQLSEAQKEQMKSQMLQSFGEKALKSNIEICSAIFPESAVAIGEKWLVKTQLEGNIAADVESNYELKECKASTCLISGTSTITSTNKDRYVQTNGMPLKYDLSGTINSEITINKTNGWILEAKVKQVLSGNAQIQDNPNLPGGMTIPMTINTATLITEK